MNERETEITASGCLWRLAAMVVAAIFGILIALMIADAIETRDNYIRDLQRRVGQLEQERR